MTKFDPHLFLNPVWKKIRPPYLFSRPPHLHFDNSITVQGHSLLYEVILITDLKDWLGCDILEWRQVVLLASWRTNDSIFRCLSRTGLHLSDEQSRWGAGLPSSQPTDCHLNQVTGNHKSHCHLKPPAIYCQLTQMTRLLKWMSHAHRHFYWHK